VFLNRLDRGFAPGRKEPGVDQGLVLIRDFREGPRRLKVAARFQNPLTGWTDHRLAFLRPRQCSRALSIAFAVPKWIRNSWPLASR